MLSADGKRQFHRDNKGSALAMVIVIIAFIAILAAVLMFLAYAGFRMRVIDKQGKDNFYTAEAVLDEINVGLQGEISVALSEAYEDIMINYALEDNANQRNKRFRETYFKALKKRLQKDSFNENVYNIELLRSYLSDESKGDITNGADGSREGFVNGAAYGAIVESDVGADDGDPLSFVMEANNTRLLLKDLRVSYVNENGYISIISTDIRIDLPSFNFAQAAALPSLDTCSLIADDTLFMGNSTEGGSITVKGDAYAGQMIIGAPNGPVSSALSDGNPVTGDTVTPTGTLLSNKSSVTFENLVGLDASDLSAVVSRNNIEVNGIPDGNNKLTTNDMELWARNLILNSADAELKGNINLKDDLTLAGKNSKVSLTGEYTGFGYLSDSSDEDDGSAGDGGAQEDDESGNAGGSASNNPDASSAIIINGKGSTLDLSGLQRMTISGRAYVATAYNAKTNPDATVEEMSNRANVMMGESVAVKSNQLIYLVPSEALGCRILKDGTIGDSEYNSNPFTLEQYEEIINNPDKYVLLDGNKQLSALGYNTLSNYIRQENVAGGGAAYVPEIIFSQTNSGPLVYCYLRFPDQDSANKYFKDYYNINAEYVDRYLKLYAKEIKMSDEMLYLNIAGNMLAYEGEETWSVVDATDSTGNRHQAQRISLIKDEAFSSLSAKMVSTSNQLTDAELGRTAFTNIVDELEVENILDIHHVSQIQIDAKDTNDNVIGSMVLTKQDEYTVDGNAPDVIISLGNVTVKSNYKGLIIAKGNITIAAGGAITLEPLDVDTFSTILRTKVAKLSPPEDGYTDDYYLMNVFVDGLSYAYSGNVAYDEGTSRVSMVDLISYERWVKK